MINDIQSDNTKRITIRGTTITINFSEDKNFSAENSVGKLLLENIFRENDNEKTSKDSIS